MDFCPCMITERRDGSNVCNQCHLDVSMCECTDLRHSFMCPDHPEQKKMHRRETKRAS